LVDIIHKKTLNISLLTLKKQNYQQQESSAQVKGPVLLLKQLLMILQLHPN